MENTEKTLFSLVCINNGVEKESLTTTDFHLAQREYHKQYRVSGITPRVFVNGIKLRICDGDELFGLANAHSSEGKHAEPQNLKQKYQNDRQKAAEQKTRMNRGRPRG